MLRGKHYTLKVLLFYKYNSYYLFKQRGKKFNVRCLHEIIDFIPQITMYFYIYIKTTNC